MVLGKSDIHKENNKVGPLPYRYQIKKLTQNQLKTNVNTRVIKPSEENIGQKLHDPGFDNDFIDIRPKA
jgi:hypothetical protein